MIGDISKFCRTYKGEIRGIKTKIAHLPSTSSFEILTNSPFLKESSENSSISVLIKLMRRFSKAGWINDNDLDYDYY